MLLSHETRVGLCITGKYRNNKFQFRFNCIQNIVRSFVELVRFIFSIPSNKGLAFLSQNICQDPLENFFGAQRQRGGTSDNPNVQEFYDNTSALRVVNSFCRQIPKGNCRGSSNNSENSDTSSEPLPKRRRVEL